MAELTEAQKAEAAKAEAARRKALTKEQREEEDRRAKLSQEERDAQDKRDADDLANVEAELAAENAAKGTGTVAAESAGSAAVRRRQIVARMKATADAQRAEQATVEVTVARGRSVFLTSDLAEAHTGGDKIMVTPQEAASLRAAGHLAVDGVVEQPLGPKVYQEAGLLQGHAPGQGTPAKS